MEMALMVRPQKLPLANRILAWLLGTPCAPKGGSRVEKQAGQRLGLARACASAAACMLPVRCPRGTAGPGVRGCAAAPYSYRRPGTRLDGITPAPRELAGGLSALHARVHGQDLEAAGGGQGRGASDLSHALRRRGQNVASKAAAQASPSQPCPAAPPQTRLTRPSLCLGAPPEPTLS